MLYLLPEIVSVEVGDDVGEVETAEDARLQ